MTRQISDTPTGSPATRSSTATNSIRNRKGHVYEIYIPSPPCLSACSNNNNNLDQECSTYNISNNNRKQVVTSRINFYVICLLCLLLLSFVGGAIMLVLRCLSHFFTTTNIIKLTPGASSSTITIKTISPAIRTRQQHHVLETSISEKGHSAVLLQQEFDHDEDFSIPLTNNDVAYAELPIFILGHNNKSTTVSFWIKFLSTTTATRRVIWTSTTKTSQQFYNGMTFFIDKNDKHDHYWWKLEYGTSNSKEYSIDIAPLLFDYTLTNNYANSWRHVALTFNFNNNLKTIQKNNNNTSILLYIDGVLLSHQSHLPNPATTSALTNNDTRSRTILGLSHETSSSSSLHGYLAMMTIWHHDNEYDDDVTTTTTTTFTAKDVEHLHNIGRLTTVTSAIDSFQNYHDSLSKRPAYFYPFNDAANMKRNQPQFFLHVDLECSYKLQEIMSSSAAAVGTFFRRVHIPYFQPLGGYRYQQHVDGTYTSPETFDKQARIESDRIARKRRVYVRNAMKHAWTSYKKYAWGYDELKPRSKKGDNNWGTQGTTIVDSLSTLWLMGMHDEFYDGRDWIRDHLSYNLVGEVSVFETTIRNLGGLLAAYDASNDITFLKKADDLGSRLVRSIHTSPSGIPYGMTVLNDTSLHGKSYNQRWLGNNAVLAELGTIQLEFRYLAAATGKKEYAAAVNKILKVVRKQINPHDGLYSIYIQNDGRFNGFAVSVPKNKISFGAMGDSFYEYMLKVWLQGGKRETALRTMYDRAMDGLHQRMIKKSNPNGLTYIAELVGDTVDQKMDHLACFMGGLLALGAYTNPNGLNSKKAQRDLQTAKALTYTCYQMYARTKTGLSSEFVSFQNSDNTSSCSSSSDFVSNSNAPFYILRPEVAESLYVLHVLTGDPIYRDWGWEIFQAIERFCRTDAGYGSAPNVDQTNLLPEDRMESFFLAETLKYLYLIQDPDSTLDILNSHVFNTEAHPLKLLNDVKKAKL